MQITPVTDEVSKAHDLYRLSLIVHLSDDELRALTAQRPCLANGAQATFLRWYEHMYTIPPSTMMCGHTGGQGLQLMAVVEYEDGTVAECLPSSIKFIK